MRRYRSLAKRWHPDRYQADPVGQADATETLRAINIAYEIVAGSLRSAEPPQPAPSSDSVDRPFSLSREQIDAIVDSINRGSKVSLLPEMSVHRWLSLAAVFAYLLGALIFYNADPRISRVVGELIVYFCLPLFLIWFADLDNRSAFESRLFRIVGWLFMALPAVVLAFWVIA